MRLVKTRRLGAMAVTLALAASVAVAATAPTPARAATTLTYVNTLGHAAHAEMYPSGLDVDDAGNVFVSDTGNDTVAKYPAGATTTSAPGGWLVGKRGDPVGIGTNSFSNPRDLAVGSKIWVADTDDQTVQVLNPSDGSWVRNISHTFKSPIGVSVGNVGGQERVLVSDGVTGNVYIFNNSDTLLRTIPPVTSNAGTRDAAIDADGNVYTADYRNNRINKYGPSGNTPILQWGGSNSADCHFVPKPYGVDIDDAGNVYVASSNLEVSKKFTSAGACVAGATYGTKAGGLDDTKIYQLRRVAVGAGASPKVYNADLWGIKILIYNQNGTLASPPRLGGGQLPDPSGFNELHDVAVTGGGANTGFVYAVDMVNQRMQRHDKAAADNAGWIDWGTKGTAETTAAFNWAQGIGVNPQDGRVWVADTRNDRVVEYGVDGSGPLRSIDNGQGSASNQVHWPMDVTFDNAGHMYVADTFNNRVSSFTVAPNSSTAPTPRWRFGTKGSGTNQFLKPWGVGFDGANDRVLVADSGNGRIISLNATNGTGWTNLGVLKGTGPGKVRNPKGVAARADGTFWVADTDNNRIQEYAANGTFTGVGLGGTAYGASNTQFNAPQGIQVGADGLLYVADTYNDRIQVFSLTGGGGGGSLTHQGNISDPGGVAPLYPAGGEADASGNRFVADSGGNRLVKVVGTNPGTITELVPGMNNPRNVSIDVGDPSILWVTNTGSNQVWRVTTAGVVQAKFYGVGSSNPTYLKSPFGIANDATGVYIADTYKNRIVKIRKDNGNEIWSETACNGALSRPRDVTVGPDGNIYAVDTDHNQVVGMNPTTHACITRFGNSTQFKGPRGITGDGNNGLWIAEARGFRVSHVNLTGGSLGAPVGSYGQGIGKLNSPACVFLDNAGDVNVCDTFAFKIARFQTNGTADPEVGGTLPTLGGFDNPFGVAYAPNGDLFVSDMYNQRIQKRHNGVWTATGKFGSQPGNMQMPRGITVTPDGNTVVLTNSEDNRVDLFNTSDLTFIKSIKPTGSKFNWPHQTALDGTTYWVADTYNNRVLHLNATGGILHTITGLSLPRGVAVDANFVYVANSGANKIQRYTKTGTGMTVLAPTVNLPWNMEIAGGKLYIADGNNGRVVVLTLANSAVTTFGSDGTCTNCLSAPRSVAIDTSAGTVAVADFNNNRISIWNL